MSSEAARRNSADALDLDIPAVSSEDLLRSLLQRSVEAGHGLGDFPDDGENEVILLDIELDGARYLLVRLPKPGSRVHLSPREHEIVRMVAEGHPNKVIAGVLNISTWTVCTHLRRIFAKFGVNSRAAMVARMLEPGQTPGALHSGDRGSAVRVPGRGCEISSAK